MPGHDDPGCREGSTVEFDLDRSMEPRAADCAVEPFNEDLIDDPYELEIKSGGSGALIVRGWFCGRHGPAHRHRAGECSERPWPSNTAQETPNSPFPPHP